MSDPRWTRLTTAQAHAWLSERPDALVLDAREAAHHLAAHLDSSLRLHRDNHETLLTTTPRRRPVFIYCHHGHASQTWAGMFSDFGFVDVADLVGGWAALGLRPDQRGPLSLADWGPSPPGVVLPPVLADWLQSQGFNPARPDTPGVHGNTPLMYAASSGKAGVVATLLSLGANPQLVTQDDFSALDMAASLDCLQLLRAATRARTPSPETTP